MSARLLLQLHVHVPVHVRRDLHVRVHVGFLLVEAGHDVQTYQESWADFYVDKLLLIPTCMQMVCRCLREEISGGANKINLKS